MFEYHFDECVESFIEDNLEFGPPPAILCKVFMAEIKCIQTTINTMWNLGYNEDYIEDCVYYGDWFSARQKSVWFNDPIDRWITRYPDRSTLDMMAT